MTGSDRISELVYALQEMGMPDPSDAADVIVAWHGELEYAHGRLRTLERRIARTRQALVMGGQTADIRCRAALVELEDVPL